MSDFHMREQFFPFRSQCDAAVGAQKKAAVQFFLQICDGSRNIRLAIHQDRCGTGETSVFGHIVEDAVIIVTD